MPITPLRGLRIPWWWLLTSRQEYRKTQAVLFGTIRVWYNADTQGYRTKPERLCTEKCRNHVPKSFEICHAEQACPGKWTPPPLPESKTGCLQLGGELHSHAAGFFSAEKPRRFSRIMRGRVRPGCACRTRMQDAAASRGPAPRASDWVCPV